MDEEKIKLMWKVILAEVGDNPEREGLLDTPKRVAKMYKELFRGYDKTQLPKVTTFTNGADGLVYDQLVTDEGPFQSLCEHHVIPFFGKYYFGYIPNPKGKILGLSKVARVVDYFSARLQIQERLVQDVVTHLWTELSKEGNEPLGMILIMEGEHLCKTMRGAKKKGNMKSCCVKGIFQTNQDGIKDEFLGLLNLK